MKDRLKNYCYSYYTTKILQFISLFLFQVLPTKISVTTSVSITWQDTMFVAEFNQPCISGFVNLHTSQETDPGNIF